MTLPPESIQSEIRAIASMASLALALLGFFTNIRFAALKEWRQGIVGPFDLATFLSSFPELLLALFTAGALFAMAPLCFAGFHLDQVGRRVGAVPSIFLLIWLGFCALLILQVGMAFTRYFDSWDAKRMSPKSEGRPHCRK